MNTNDVKEFDCDLFYAPVAPIDADRVLISAVHHVNLHMIRSGKSNDCVLKRNPESLRAITC